MARTTPRALTIATMAALSLAACAGPDQPATDLAGNIYPPQCRGDMSYVTAPIGFVPPNVLAALYGQHLSASQRVYGVTIARKMIFIDATLGGWKREDVIRHERCHVIAGNWHR